MCYRSSSAIDVSNYPLPSSCTISLLSCSRMYGFLFIFTNLFIFFQLVKLKKKKKKKNQQLVREFRIVCSKGKGERKAYTFFCIKVYTYWDDKLFLHPNSQVIIICFTIILFVIVKFVINICIILLCSYIFLLLILSTAEPLNYFSYIVVLPRALWNYFSLWTSCYLLSWSSTFGSHLSHEKRKCNEG